MKKILTGFLRSPCCCTTLHLSASKETAHFIVEGALICSRCRRSFPLRQGVAYLCLLNPRWHFPLQELVSRRLITWQTIQGAYSDQEQATVAEQHSEAAAIMDHLFQEAYQQLRLSPQSSVLELGAGEGQTTARLASAAQLVTAVDTEPSSFHYLSFQTLNPPAPRSTCFGNRTYYEFLPDPLPDYFNRIVASGEQLPFAPNSFDIVFCRSTLHHLAHLRISLAELLRVCKPGGQLVFCSEPLRSIIDPESFYLEGVADSEAGLNERCPHLLAYLLPLGRHTHSFTVQYWRRPPAAPTRLLTRLLPVGWERHFRDGELASRRKLLKLLLTSASINMYAIKKKASPDTLPGYWDTREIIPVSQLAELHTRPWEQAWEQFQDDTRQLQAWRRTLLSHDQLPPPSLVPAARKPYELWTGWGAKVKVEGKWCRAMKRLCLFTLANPRRQFTHLSLRYFLPQAPQQLTIYFNEQQAWKGELEKPGWGTLELPLTQATIFDVELRATKKFSYPPVREQVALLIERIALQRASTRD